MRTSVTQEHDFGCGAACLAFVVGKNYKEVVRHLGKTKAATSGYYCNELVAGLNKFGFPYFYLYLKSWLRRKIYQDGVIVFIKKSKKYPAGHYLVRYKGLWMDPWINFVENKNIKEAESDFRKKLPGSPIYGLFPKI
ncbi:hypothetical protein HYT33_00050 [Candidatus Roizmanbacteria bacterium]|nr:hypothetical protein [Candidatus Roizmanbacteria bacterium]